MESSPLRIGVVADPEHWKHWEEAKAYLEPARARGDFATVIEPDELLWAVLDGDELLACATAWLAKDHYVEVKLVGGRDSPRWIKELNDRIGAAAAEAGATRMVAIGRRGWLKSLKRLGWVKHGEIEDQTIYARELET